MMHGPVDVLYCRFAGLSLSVKFISKRMQGQLTVTVRFKESFSMEKFKVRKTTVFIAKSLNKTSALEV